VTAVVGLVSLYCMGSIYANSSVAAWETFYTQLSFFTAALMLGCFIYAGVAAGLPEPSSLRRDPAAAAFGAVAAGLYLIGSFVYLIVLAEGSPAAQQSLALVADVWLLAAGGQMFALAGLVAAAILWSRQRKDQAPVAGGWIYGSLSLMALAVLIGRYLFYSSGVLPMGQL
jgi:DMSO reductase anchor subunit